MRKALCNRRRALPFPPPILLKLHCPPFSPGHGRNGAALYLTRSLFRREGESSGVYVCESCGCYGEAGKVGRNAAAFSVRFHRSREGVLGGKV